MKLHRKITALIFCVGLLEPVSLAHGEDQLQEYKRSEEAVVSAPLHLDTSDGGYYVSIKVGTPPQALQLRLASNITLTWLLERYSVGGCPQTGCQHGSFDIDDSSTANKSIDDPLKAVDTIDGYHFTDTLTIGDVAIPDFRMGLVNSTNTPLIPVLGLGRGKGNNSELALANEMVSHGLINSAAYSLLLEEDANAGGNILFGALDTAKYYDPLKILNAYHLPGEDDAPCWQMFLSAVEAISPSGADSVFFSPITVSLWYERPENRLPLDIANQLLNIVDAELDKDLGIHTVPCWMNASAGSFIFSFGGQDGPAINVSMANLVAPNSGITQGTDDEERCQFLITAEVDQANWSLGWSFLKGAYVVLDVSNNKIGIAQAKHNAESSIKTFEGNNAPIPFATYIPYQPTYIPAHPSFSSMPGVSTSFPAASGFRVLSTTTSASGTPDETATPEQPSDGSSISSTTIGMAVGIPVAVICIAAVGFLFYRKRKARKGNHGVSQGGEPESMAQPQPPPLPPPQPSTLPQVQTHDELPEDYYVAKDQRLSHTTTIAPTPQMQTIGELESNGTPSFHAFHSPSSAIEPDPNLVGGPETIREERNTSN